MHTHYQEIDAYETMDGSVIRELMHPAVHGNQGQSLAEAIVAPGAETRLHRHLRSEEIYHVAEGVGQMYLGDAIFPLEPGDTVCIRPGTPHKLCNTGAGPLRILCACTPAYSHDDTELC